MSQNIHTTNWVTLYAISGLCLTGVSCTSTVESPEALPKSGVSRWTCALTAEQLTVRFTAASETRRRTPRATIQDIASPWHYTIQPSCRTEDIAGVYRQGCEAQVTVHATDGSATYQVEMEGRSITHGNARGAWYFAADLNVGMSPERVMSMIWSRANARVVNFDHTYSEGEAGDYSVRFAGLVTCVLVSSDDEQRVM